MLNSAGAVEFNPDVWYFFSSDVRDSELGNILAIGQLDQLFFLIDSFSPPDRAKILAQESNHCGVIWVLS